MFDVFLPLLRNVGQLAIVAMIYGLFIARLSHTLWPFVLGILCGVGAVLAIMDPTQIAPGVFVDTRTTMMLTAGFFGGPVSAAIALLIAGSYRISLDGPSLPIGLAVLTTGCLIGLCLYYLFARWKQPIRMRQVLVLALVSPLIWISVVILPWSEAVALFDRLFLPANAVRVASVLLLGLMILNEQKRVLAENTVRRLAFVDELSGLANRRAFYGELDHAWARFERYGEPYCVVLVDIDHFKSINDAYGHPTGDEVIRRLGEILREACRKTDTAARLGGEEFAFLLANAHGHVGVTFAERVRRRVEAEELIPSDGPPLRFTISLGVSRDVTRTTSRHELLSSADTALYTAKRNGRNRVALDAKAPLPAA